MIISEQLPDPALRQYIECYWSFEGSWPETETIRLLPGGNIDIIINLGKEIRLLNNDLIIEHEGVYLIGMMNQYGDHFLNEQTSLFGIRFHPGAFPHFYTYDSLHHLANRISEFEHHLFPDVHQVVERNVAYLDQFFLNRMKQPKNSIGHVLSDIQSMKGQLEIDDLIRKYLMTGRQLERYFQSQVGISPKAFANMVRFTHTMRRLRQRRSGESIMDIAFDCGYYDHAHLSNDIRQYTGMTPSQIILSDFSKITV